MRHVQSIALILCLAAASGRAARADTALLHEATGLTEVAMWLDSGAPGMVLVVARGQETLVHGYGETTKGNGKEPDGRSLLRLGSISKVFTTELLAGMASLGALRLTDPLQQYAAAAVTVPRFGDRMITLLDLATHSAGLPREIGEVPANTIPFTWPTNEEAGRFSPATNCRGRPAPSPPTRMSASICSPTRSPRPAARITQPCCTTGYPAGSGCPTPASPRPASNAAG